MRAALNPATSFLILSRQPLPRISGKPLAIAGRLWSHAPSLVWSARVRSGDPLCRDERQRHGERVRQAREILQLAGVSLLAYVPPAASLPQFEGCSTRSSDAESVARNRCFGSLA
jgi:hypothetical protein